MWDSIPECTAEHACAILAPAAQSRSQQKKTKCKPANDGRKVTASNVGCQCPASKPVAQRRSLMGGSLRSLLRGLLLLSCCGALGIWLAPDVTTGPSSFATSALPSMQAASSGTLTPPLPRLEFTPERSSPFVTSSYVSRHHVLEASLPSVVIFRVPKVFFFTMPAVPSDPPNTNQVLIHCLATSHL